MSLTLSNPAGLWALLGIPAVLLIHLLQRRAQVVPSATLFLLEHSQREAAGGRRLERLVASLPLWMQLLAVLLLTWLLVEPRFPKAHALQRVAVVVDASASMELSREPLARRLAGELPRLVGPATAAEFVLLESTAGAPPLYSGTAAGELVARLGSWRPRAGLTDPAAALQLARSLVSPAGIVVFATDTPHQSLPFDALLLAVGQPFANAGFTGVSFEPRDAALAWHALVRNYSPLPATRSWAVELPDGSRTPPTPLTLAPGALARLDGEFPAGTPRLRVVLDPDRFTLDDTLPLVAPLPKPLAIHALPAPETDARARRLADALEAAHPAPDAASADVLVARVDPPGGPLPPANAIVFAANPDPGPTPAAGPVLTAHDPLVDGLDWQPLEVAGGTGLAAASTDRVLLWQGERPLVVLRAATAGEPPRPVRQLLFQFDLRHSNAAQLPAFAVLLHRFCAAVREAKVAPARAVLETGEPVTLAADPAGPQLDVQALALDGSATAAAALPAAARVHTEAPPDPGFVAIRQGKLALLDAAVHFGDTREADFSACGEADDLASATPATIRRHTRADHWWRAWLLALVLALLVAWRYTEPAARQDGWNPLGRRPVPPSRPFPPP